MARACIPKEAALAIIPAESRAAEALRRCLCGCVEVVDVRDHHSISLLMEQILAARHYIDRDVDVDWTPVHAELFIHENKLRLIGPEAATAIAKYITYFGGPAYERHGLLVAAAKATAEAVERSYQERLREMEARLQKAWDEEREAKRRAEELERRIKELEDQLDEAVKDADLAYESALRDIKETSFDDVRFPINNKRQLKAVIARLVERLLDRGA